MAKDYEWTVKSIHKKTGYSDEVIKDILKALAELLSQANRDEFELWIGWIIRSWQDDNANTTYYIQSTTK